MIDVLLKRQPFKDRHTQGECHVTTKANIGAMQLQARLPATHQNLRGRQGSPISFRGSTTDTSGGGGQLCLLPEEGNEIKFLC